MLVEVTFSILASLLGRTLSDALHISGFYDSLSPYLAGLLLPLPLAIIVSIISYIILIAYYKVYLFLLWMPPLLTLFGWLAKKRDSVLIAIPASLVYALLWFLLYVYLSHTWHYLPILLGSRGFVVLILDSLASFIIAYAFAKRCIPRLKRSRKLFVALLTFTIIIIVVSWAYTSWNDYFVGNYFPEIRGWKLFRTHKMDIVWLPMGSKGTNTYYYPIDRFDRNSTGYQVWFGMYWIQGRHDIKDVGLISQFAIWDQNFWLGIHGCPKPYTYVDLVKSVKEITFAGHKAVLMYGGMVSRSDVKPYEEVKLRGFFITFYDAKSDHTAIIYGCATEKNYPKMIKVLEEMVKELEERMR